MTVDRENESIAMTVAAGLQPVREIAELACPNCGEPLTPDWVGDPKVGWCSPCNAWNFELTGCACPPGWKHDPTCPEVVGYPTDAA